MAVVGTALLAARTPSTRLLLLPLTDSRSTARRGVDHEQLDHAQGSTARAAADHDNVIAQPQPKMALVRAWRCCGVGDGK